MIKSFILRIFCAISLLLPGTLVAAAPDAEGASLKLLENLQIRGDLNGDGDEELALVLVQDPSGSGTFLYLTVLGLADNEVVARSAFIGDRVQVRGGEFGDGMISLDVIQSGQGDPACCPSQKAIRRWELEGARLVEQPVELKGRISLEDLDGSQWVLRSLGADPLPDEPPINLAVKDGQIKGFAACNNYFADIKDDKETAGSVKVGPVGSTRRACSKEVMDLESRYLQALGKVSRFSFMGSHLVLSWTGDNEPSGYLLFAPKAMTP